MERYCSDCGAEQHVPEGPFGSTSIPLNWIDGKRLSDTSDEKKLRNLKIEGY